MEITSNPVERSANKASDYTRGDCRVFGIPVVDSLLPDGVPVPCSLLIAADPGSGSEVISTAIMQEHLSIGQRALWLSLENLVDDLRGDIHYLWIANQPQVQFIDCYSSQIGIDSKEQYNCDPSNLPYLSMVTSAAMNEMTNDGGRLLVILDSLTSLIQKVGVRRSTEFLRTLIGKARSISADLLTTLNRAAFSEATLATFADLTDIVLELAIEDSETSSGKVRVRKARSVRHHKSWRAYAIDLEHRTLRCDLLPSLELDQLKKKRNGNGHGLEDSYPIDLVTEDETDGQLKPGLNIRCEGPFCTLGGRALMERERLAIMAEAVGTLALEYQESLRAIERLAKQLASSGSNDSELLMELSKRIQNMSRVFKIANAQNHIRPNLRLSKANDLIQRSLVDSIVPTNIEVIRESESSANVFTDPAMTVRALSGVIEAAVQEMPYGGFLSISNSEEADMSLIVVKDNGMGKWNDDLSGVFNVADHSNPAVGLGLVVARRFIESMKGQLRIESESGRGTRFIVKLPKKPVKASDSDSMSSLL